MRLEDINIKELNKAPYNPRTISKDEFRGLVASIRAFGIVDPIIVNKDMTIIGGHQRLEACKELGYETVPCVVLDLDKKQEKKLNVILNSQAISGHYDQLKLDEILEELKLDTDYEELRLNELESIDLSNKYEDGEKGSMRDNFIYPPFSVLNAREGDWQDRKRKWLSRGIESGLGRKENLLSDGNSTLLSEIANGTSVFDPVLTELMYRWFNVEGGQILDPFAGGSVRGIVANLLGYKYVGIDLSNKQVEENRKQAKEVCTGTPPIWLTGDSLEIKELASGIKADMIFSCPPYADLEKYSEDPSDLSNMPYSQFKETYSKIIENTSQLLNENRFAVFVVGEVRNKEGGYVNLIPDTIEAFEKAGLHYYNEIILVTPIGTLPLRAGKTFRSSRKIGKTHQNILVFYKGNIKEVSHNFDKNIEILENNVDIVPA